MSDPTTRRRFFAIAGLASASAMGAKMVLRPDGDDLSHLAAIPGIVCRECGMVQSVRSERKDSLLRFFVDEYHAETCSHA